MGRVLASLAVYREPRIAALLFLGFSSGLPLALTGQTLAAWLTEDGLSLGSIGLFAAVGTPYALKFLWAPLMDRLPLGLLTRRFGRRRGWLLFTQAGLIAAVLGLAGSDPAGNLGLTALFALAVAFASASQDIVVDAYRVEILAQRQLAAGAAAVVFGYRVAMLVSSAGALYLAEFFGWQVTYLVMAALVLVGVVTVLANPEPAVARSADLDGRERRMADWRAARPHLAPAAADAMGFLYVAVLAPFAEFMGRRGWIGVLLFVVFYKFGDSLAGVMTTPFLLKIGFSKPEIANVVKLYGFVATFVGLALGGWLMNAAGMIRSLWIAGILQLASNFMFAVQALAGHDIGLLALTISFENLAGGMGTAVFVAYLSALCNRAYTATQYALVSSFMATARTWLVSSAGFMADELGWVWFFAATAGAALPGLILLWWLARRGFGAPEGVARQAT